MRTAHLNRPLVSDIDQAVSEMPLLDHHAHGIRLAPVSLREFGDLIEIIVG